MIDVPVLVKDALRDGRRLKNYKINVMQDDGITLDFVIDNNSLVSESVKFDERMSSGKDLVFGLCEGASIEFQYFDNPSILGRRIQVLIDVQYQTVNNELSWYEIPIGWFDVDACPRQASTGIRKVTAYNKLKSDYLDQKANDNLEEIFTHDYTLTVHDIKKALLGAYQVDEDRTKISSRIHPVDIIETQYLSLGTNLRLTSLYGVDSPINAYPLNISSLNTPIYIRATSLEVPYGSKRNAGIDALHGDLIGYEENYLKWLKNIIEVAPINKTWDEVLDYMCTHDGRFQHLCGVYIQVYDDVDGVFRDYWYSTVQWNYEEDHNLVHTVDGTLADVMYRLTPNGPREYTQQVMLYYPDYIEFSLSSYEATGYAFSKYGFNYDWYVDSSLTTTETSSWPALKYSDGTSVSSEAGETDNIIMYNYVNLPTADSITFKISEMPDFTLRDLTSAVYETVCQYGRLDRVTDLFAGIELNRSQLLPQDTLYPAADLYPGGPSFSAARSTYSKLWADEDNVQKFRYLIITYKGLDGDNKEKEFTLQRTVNPDGTQDYYCSDNWLFKNLVWTANDIEAYADAMVAKMQDIRWFPFEMWCAGLPYLETGDAIEIPMGEDSYTSYILQRNLNGIQNLQDTFINGTLDIF